MKTNNQALLKFIREKCLATLGIVLIACPAVCPVSARTTIGFDGAGWTDGDLIPQLFASGAQSSGPGYTVSMGREVMGTPHVTVWWVQEEPGMVFRLNWDGRGSVVQMNPPANPFMSLGLVFMTDPGRAAILDSFDLDLKSGAGPVDVDWSFSSNGLRSSGKWQRTTPGRDTIIPEYTGTPSWGDHFFFLKINTGDPGSLAMDNITFDELVVPEPSMPALLMLGGFIWACKRLFHGTRA